jgi:hypothetical protein
MDEEVIAVVALCLIFGAPCVVMILSRLFKTIENTARGHQETVLRMKMIDRGYSASEIERVCKLPLDDRKRAAESADWVPVAPAKPAKV